MSNTVKTDQMSNAIIKNQLRYEPLRRIGLVKQAAYMESLIRDNLEVNEYGVVKYKEGNNDYIPAYTREELAEELMQVCHNVPASEYVNETPGVFDRLELFKIRKLAPAYVEVLKNELNWALTLAKREFIGLMAHKHIPVEVIASIPDAIEYYGDEFKLENDLGAEGDDIDAAIYDRMIPAARNVCPVEGGIPDIVTYIDYIDYLDEGYTAKMRIKNRKNGNKAVVKFEVAMNTKVNNQVKRMQLIGYNTFRNMVAAVNAMEAAKPYNTVIVHAEHLIGRMQRSIDLSNYANGVQGNELALMVRNYALFSRHEHKGLDVSVGPEKPEGTDGLLFTASKFGIGKRFEQKNSRVPSIDLLYDKLSKAGLSLQAQYLKDRVRGIPDDIDMDEAQPAHFEVEDWVERNSVNAKLTLYEAVYTDEIEWLLKLSAKVVDIASNNTISTDSHTEVSMDKNIIALDFDGWCGGARMLYPCAKGLEQRLTFSLDKSTYISALDASVSVECCGEDARYSVNFAVAIPIDGCEAWEGLDKQVFHTAKSFITSLSNIEQKHTGLLKTKEILKNVDNNKLMQIVKTVIAEELERDAKLRENYNPAAMSEDDIEAGRKSPEQLRDDNQDDYTETLMQSENDDYISDWNENGIDPVVELARATVLDQAGAISLKKSSSNIRSIADADNKIVELARGLVGGDLKNTVAAITREQCNRLHQLSGMKIGFNCKLADGFESKISSSLKQSLPQIRAQLGAGATYLDVAGALNGLVKIPQNQMIVTIQAVSNNVKATIQAPIKIIDTLAVYDNDPDLSKYISAMQEILETVSNMLMYGVAVIGTLYNEPDELKDMIETGVNNSFDIQSADGVYELCKKDDELYKTAGLDKRVVCRELAKAIRKDMSKETLERIVRECR